MAGSKGHLHVHPMFLHSNATSHKWAFGGIELFCLFTFLYVFYLVKSIQLAQSSFDRLMKKYKSAFKETISQLFLDIKHPFYSVVSYK